MNHPRNRLFFRKFLAAIHLHVRGSNSYRATCSSRKVPRLLRDARVILDKAQLRMHRFFLNVVKRTGDLWNLLRRTQIISLPLFPVGLALTTFLYSTQLIGPENLRIAIRTCALGMLACSTLAYGFAVVFGRVENGCP